MKIILYFLMALTIIIGLFYSYIDFKAKLNIANINLKNCVCERSEK